MNAGLGYAAGAGLPDADIVPHDLGCATDLEATHRARLAMELRLNGIGVELTPWPKLLREVADGRSFAPAFEEIGCRSFGLLDLHHVPRWIEFRIGRVWWHLS